MSPERNREETQRERDTQGHEGEGQGRRSWLKQRRTLEGCGWRAGSPGRLGRLLGPRESCCLELSLIVPQKQFDGDTGDTSRGAAPAPEHWILLLLLQNKSLFLLPCVPLNSQTSACKPIPQLLGLPEVNYVVSFSPPLWKALHFFLNYPH